MIHKVQFLLQKIVSLRVPKGRSNLVLRIASSPAAPRNDNFLTRDDNTGQVTLEFTLILVIMVALLMGLLGLWKWSSDNIIHRQSDYNGSRVKAGSISSPGAPASWTGGADFSNNSIYLTR